MAEDDDGSSSADQNDAEAQAADSGADRVQDSNAAPEAVAVPGAEPAADTAPPDEPGGTQGLSEPPFDELTEAMAAAREAEPAPLPPPQAPAPAPPAASAVLELPELDQIAVNATDAQGIDLLRDVNLTVKIELGRSRMLVQDVLRLGEGSVVELDKLAGDPVDILVNGRLVGRGEVLVLNDNFCVRINDILSQDPDDSDGE